MEIYCIIAWHYFSLPFPSLRSLIAHPPIGVHWRVTWKEKNSRSHTSESASTQVPCCSNGQYPKSWTKTHTWWVDSSKKHIEEVLGGNVCLEGSVFWPCGCGVPPLLFTLIILSPFANVAQNRVSIPYSCGTQTTWALFTWRPSWFHFGSLY